jgi:H+-transporting ATPase
MTPLGWGWTLFVWGYALVWFLVNDRVKLLAYRIFDRTKAGDTPEERAHAKSEAKTATQPDRGLEARSDLTPQIARRAYELYEREGHQDGRSVQDWNQAEHEIRKEKAPK